VRTLADQYLTLADAAQLANRSKMVIRRWITEGWIPEEYVLVSPGNNGAWLIEKEQFQSLLPGLLEEMGKRKGGRGRKAPDARGNLRGA
jgi:hypothetical protein